jgi:hypothetical protein
MTLDPKGYAQKFNDWVNCLPTTNFRILVSVILSAFFVAVVTIGLILQRVMDAVIVGLVMSFLAAMMALDVKQFSVKRNTEVVTPPDTTVKQANDNG